MSSMKSKDRKSLCEESMLVFVNILKLSSLSIARRTLVTTSDDDDNHNHQVKKVVHHTTPSYFPVPESQRKKRSAKRSQKPEQAPESTYVMLPEHDEISNVDGKFSDYIERFHKNKDKELQNAIVEGKAENYIKKFHEKNRKDLNNESVRRAHYVLTPPPRYVFE